MMSIEKADGVTPVNNLHRRAADMKVMDRLRYILLRSDISFTILVCGILLPVWSISQISVDIVFTDFLKYPGIFIDSYINHKQKFFVTNHFFIGFSLIWLSIKNFPNPYTQLISVWMFYVWLNVMFSDTPVITDRVLAIIFIFLSFMIIHRSISYKEKRRGR